VSSTVHWCGPEDQLPGRPRLGAEQTVVPVETLVPIDRSVPPWTAAMLSGA
jgi:hypothetical protein